MSNDTFQCSRKAETAGNELKMKKCGITVMIMSVLLTGTMHAATVNEPETWDGGDTAGWVSFDLINESVVPRLSVESNAAKLVFAAQSIKLPPEEYLVKADMNASGGRFVGNYITNGVMGISFRLYCEYVVDVRVAFYNEGTRRLWRYRAPDIVAGQWQTVNVPVDPELLNNVNGVEGWSAFKQDLENVSWTGVIITRNANMKAQLYRLDDFEIIGVGPDYGQWIEQFGSVGDGNTLPGSDLDNDGADNYSEWIAGTSAGDAEHSFDVEIDEPGTGSGIMLRWESAADRTYRVERTDALTTEFTPITGELDATPPENTFEDTTATNDTPYFYRLRVQKP